MPFDFLGRIAAINPANLTIREQVRLSQNPNDMRWPAIFPRVPTPSVKLSTLSRPDVRFAGGRREWNAQGREIPLVLGTRVDAEMVPINPTHHFDERALQAIRERSAGVAELFNQNVIADVDRMGTILADAVDRQIEADAFSAWFTNSITVADPKTGSTVTVSLGISSSRYVAAATTLAAATNAYLDFMGYLRDARNVLGSVGAVRMRNARLTEILADAPAFSGDRMSRVGLTQRMADEGFGNVAIIDDERTYNSFTDGGSAYGTSYFVPADRIAFQPAGGVVGATYFAPVTRAYDYMAPQAVRNVQDVTVFYSEKNDGKTLMEEAQANALSIPDEQNVYVVTGVA